MNRVHYVPPVVALIIAAAWLINSRGARSTLEQENALLRGKLASSRNSAFIQNARAGAQVKRVRAGSGKKPPQNANQPSADWVGTSRDWNKLVLFNNNEGMRFNLTTAYRRLEKLATEMSGDELVKAYTEMAALPVEGGFRSYLEQVMLSQLENKNPEFAFSQYIALHEKEGRMPWFRLDYMKWLTSDPAAATTWYESQLAAGVFDKSLDGRNPAVIPFESAFMMSLLASDPSAAEQRMNNIPQDFRASLKTFMWDVPKEKRQPFIDLLRKTMPVEEYVSLLRATSVFDFNFRSEYNSNPENAKISLDSLAVTPEERIALLVDQFSEFAEYRAFRVSGGGDPRRNEFDANRKWVQAVDPASADRATGAALQSFVKKLNNPESHDFVEKTALDYLESGAGDELLVPLIEGSATGSNTFPKDRARGLAGRITDAGLRNELLQKLN